MAETLESRTMLFAGAAADYVIVISVDGLRPGAIDANAALDVSNPLAEPRADDFMRFRSEGAWTNNARTDKNHTNTMPNHTSQVTSRGVDGAAGHNWINNNDPWNGVEIHENKNPDAYVASMFDVAHDRSLSTGVFVTKRRFALYPGSYDNQAFPDGGATDAYMADGNQGLDKILGVGGVNGEHVPTGGDSPTNTTAMMTQLMASLNHATPNNLTYVHFLNPDYAGHNQGGWTTSESPVTYNPNYLSAVATVDNQLDTIFAAVENPSSPLYGRTTIILTADHAGTLTDHSGTNTPTTYTIPFYVWGAGVIDLGANGSDLYAINSTSRTVPAAGDNPAYDATPGDNPTQPIRNGDAGNLAVDLLGLPPIPGSHINSKQSLNVGTLDIDGDVNDVVTNDNINVTVSGSNFVITRNAAPSWSVPTAHYNQIIVHGRDGNDTVDLNDVITLPSRLNGGSGTDNLNGAAGNDRIDGGTGADTITPDGGNDTLVGDGDGDTYVFAGTTNQGSDIVDDNGTSGTDILRFHGLNSGISLNLTSGSAQALSSLLTLTLVQPANIENVATNNGGSNTFADSIIGNAADNNIETFGGDDVLHGSGGNDTLVGGNGGDTYVFAGSTHQGSDVVDEVGVNTGNPDVLDFTNLAAGVQFNMGSILTQAGSMLLTLRFTSGSTLENATTSQIGAYDDYMIGNSLNNKIQTWDGIDNLYGGWGNDTLMGGASDDTMVGEFDTGSGQTFGNDSMYGEGGNDLMYGDNKNAIFTSSSYANGNDNMFGGPGDDTMQGDALLGGIDKDGDDGLYGEDGDDTLWGDTGSDYDPNPVFSSYGDDILNGGNGNDTLRGQEGSDRYYWSSDQFGPLSQTDTLTEYASGGSGDTLDFASVTQAVTIDLSSTAATQTVVSGLLVLALPSSSALNLEHVNGGSAGDLITGNGSFNLLHGYNGNDTLIGGDGVDWMYGDNDDDSLRGGNGNDSVFGDAGNDILEGEGNNDQLFGGANDDALTGGANDDVLQGGTGNDTYYFAGSTSLGSDTLTEGANADTDVINLSGLGVGANLLLWKTTAHAVATILTLTNTVATGIENAVGTPFNDLIEGNDRPNTLAGGNGDDYLLGYVGNDDLNGDAGNDHCYGGLGDDIVRGGTGADDLFGQEDNDVIYAVNNSADSGNADGADTLHGGDGTDSFFFRAGEDLQFDP